jgi:hypothetical protein
MVVVVVVEFIAIMESLISVLCLALVVSEVVATVQGILQLLVLTGQQIQVEEVVVALLMILLQELPAGLMVVLVDLEL